MPITVGQFEAALKELQQMEPMIHFDTVHSAIRRHYDRAVELLVGEREGEWNSLDPQKVRDELLLMRELMGDEYDSLPACDKLIRHCDNALEAVPGEGEQSQAPYE